MINIQQQEKVYDIVIYSTYILYILTTLGLSAAAPNYLSTFDYFIKIYISLFLLIRFNPFRKLQFTSLDQKIAFSAGLFMFYTTFLSSLLINYVKDIKNYITSIFYI